MDASSIANSAKAGFRQSLAKGKINFNTGKATEITKGLKGSLHQ